MRVRLLGLFSRDGMEFESDADELVVDGLTFRKTDKIGPEIRYPGVVMRGPALLYCEESLGVKLGLWTTGE